jgi:calcineurin-like phosphoesterase
MMNQDNMIGMYSDDDVHTEVPTGDNRLVIGQKGMITEVEINGKKLAIIDPAVVQGLDRLIRSLQTKISVMEQDIRSLRSRLALTETNLRNARIELDGKVSYSRE